MATQVDDRVCKVAQVRLSPNLTPEPAQQVANNEGWVIGQLGALFSNIVMVGWQQ